MGAAADNSRGADNGAARLISDLKLSEQQRRGHSLRLFCSSASASSAISSRGQERGGGAGGRIAIEAAEMAFLAALFSLEDLPAEGGGGPQRRQRAGKRAFLIVSPPPASSSAAYPPPVPPPPASSLQRDQNGSSGGDQGGRGRSSASTITFLFDRRIFPLTVESFHT